MKKEAAPILAQPRDVRRGAGLFFGFVAEV